MEKGYLVVELNIFKERRRSMAHRKFYQIIFLETFIFEVPSCKQNIKIGHRAENKCFPQILFPVHAILRSI